MRTVKQSTAYDLAVFMTDAADHVSGKTGLTLTITASKAGGSFASISPTVTELSSGWYKVALTSSHTDTLGDLALHITGSGADPTDLLMQVRANILGDTLPANVTQFGGSNGTFASGRPEVNTTHLAGTSQTARDIGASVLVGDKTGFSLSSAGVQAIWDALTSALTTVGSIGKLLADNINATISSRSSHSAADVWSAATRTLTSVSGLGIATAAKLTKYVQLLARKDSAIATDNATELTEINADGGSGAGAFANTTDSQEALRDRGDAAWVTATGFSTLDAAGVRSAVGLASANLDTQLAALPTAAENADAVWEEAIADHSGTAGSTAESLNAAGSAGDPWTTALPGSYTGSQAGKLLSDILTDSGTSLDGKLDTVDTVVDAIKAKTDNLPAAPAATGDIPSAAAVASQVRTELTTELGRIDAAVSSRLAAAGYTAPLDAAGVRSAVGLASANLDTQLGAIAGYIDTEVAAIISAIAALNNISTADVLSQVQSALTATVADSVPANGTRPSVSSGIYMLTQFLIERAVSGTTVSVKKPDGSTQLFALTIDDATSPTSITRSA